MEKEGNFKFGQIVNQFNTKMQVNRNQEIIRGPGQGKRRLKDEETRKSRRGRTGTRRE